MNPLAWLNPARWLLYLGLAAALVLGYLAWEHHIDARGDARGAARVQAQWNAATIQQQQVDLRASEANAKETQRRLDRQKENQDAQDKQLAAARDAAGRNGADADRLRDQNATVAKQWRDALGYTATGGECPAAGDAIGVLADVLGRADRRAGVLASVADAARAAGLKCERDYDALTAPP